MSERQHHIKCPACEAEGDITLPNEFVRFGCPDARAGAITEATDAGASLEDVHGPRYQSALQSRMENASDDDN